MFISFIPCRDLSRLGVGEQDAEPVLMRGARLVPDAVHVGEQRGAAEERRLEAGLGGAHAQVGQQGSVVHPGEFYFY